MSKENNNGVLQPDAVDGQKIENSEEKKDWLPIRGIRFVGRQIAKIPGAVREHPKAAAVVFTAIGFGLKTGFDAIMSTLSGDDDSSDEPTALLPEAEEEVEEAEEAEESEEEVEEE